MYLLYTDDNSPAIVSSGGSQDCRNRDHFLSNRLIRAVMKKEGLVKREDPLRDSDLRPSLAYGKYGKPQLRNYPFLHLNISHSAGKAVCCVSDGEVGIDLQRKSFRTAEKCMRLASRFFPREDTDLLQSLSAPEEIIDLFFSIWTIREAYLKLTGEGLAGGLDSFQIDFENHLILKNHAEAFWIDLEIPSRFGPEYCGTLCSYTPVPSPIASEYL